MRALIYVRLPEGKVDERGFAALKADQQRIAGRQAHRARPVQGDREGAIPDPAIGRGTGDRCVPEAVAGRSRGNARTALALVRRVLAARGALPEEGRRRLERIEAMFAGPPPTVAQDKAA